MQKMAQFCNFETMKKCSFIITLLFAPLLIQAQNVGLIWEPAVVISEGEPTGFLQPSVALTNTGPIITWGKEGGLNAVMYSRWDGNNFSNPLRINPPGLNPRILTTYGPGLVTYGDTVYITFSSLPEMTGHVYLLRSIDGGITFDDTVRVDALPAGYHAMAPHVDVDPLGNPSICYTSMLNGVPAIASSNSYNGGSTYDAPVPVTPTPTDCCPPYMVINNDFQAVLFRNNDNTLKTIHAGISQNGGATFDTIVRVDPSNYLAATCPISGAQGMVTNDTLYSIYMSGADGQAKIFVSPMHTSTLELGPTVQVDPTVPPGSVIQRMASIAGNGDTLGVVWSDTRNGTYDVFFAWSVTGLHGLSAPINIVDTTVGHSQSAPQVIFNNGKFHIVWQVEQSYRVMYRTACISNQIGINEQEEDLALAIAPNPFRESTQITFNNPHQNATIRLYDLAGKLVMKETNITSNRLTIHRNQLPVGMYELVLQVGDVATTQKLMIK